MFEPYTIYPQRQYVAEFQKEDFGSMGELRIDTRWCASVIKDREDIDERWVEKQRQAYVKSGVKSARPVPDNGTRKNKIDQELIDLIVSAALRCGTLYKLESRCGESRSVLRAWREGRFSPKPQKAERIKATLRKILREGA